MNKGFQTIGRSAILEIALFAALASAPNAFAQHRWPGRPTGAAPSAQEELAAMPPAHATASAPGKKTSAGEQFFIVASVDLQKSQMLLKHPTEVTQLVRVDNNTKFLDESGKPSRLSDLRAGDTLWVVSTEGRDEATAIRVRKGRMTVADLHRYYLDYPEIK